MKKFELSDEAIENIVRRSYQYVAMYNTINNFALDENNPSSTHGWNKIYVPTDLADHTLRSIPRPNNDTLYLLASLDLRNDAVIIEFPRFDSKYVSLETSAYDHYVKVPLSTRKGDFDERTRILFYSDRTQNYDPEMEIEGVDRKVKMTGDFAIAFLRVTPHATDECRLQHNLCAMKSQKIFTLYEYLNGKRLHHDEVTFPDYGNDQQVFSTNFLEVMQFVFNCISFDPEIEMDQRILAIMKRLGVEPGKEFDPEDVAPIKLDRFAEAAQKVAEECLVSWNSGGNEYLTKLFRPKGHMQLRPMTMQSAVGPVGLPYEEAQYPGIKASNNDPISAKAHYIITMTADDMPPAGAFWSITLYDSKHGFFIPNQNWKYSVGENGGIKLDENGGVQIHICPDQPEGDVPLENWLPSGKIDQDLDLVMRVYAPDLTRMGDEDELVGRRWSPPEAILQE